MAVKNQVLVEFAPKITPTRIEFIDLETDQSENKVVEASGQGFVREAGKVYPLVEISGMTIPAEEMLSFTLYQNDFLPRIHLSFMDNNYGFTTNQFPTKKPIVSVFLAPSHTKLKSLSADFLITEIRSINIPDDGIRYDFIGELYVPNLYANKSAAYRSMTSVEALRKIAGELGLGFATNEDRTDDTMTWINPNLNYKTFINQITNRAYKNEKSFFTCFIDRNYILNFVNVEKQFARDKEVDVTYGGYDNNIMDERRYEYDRKESEDYIEIPMVLTYSTGTAKSDMSIIDYSLISENGDVLKSEAFRKNVKWYSHGEKTLDFFVEPISDLNPDGEVSHQTPELEDFAKNQIVKWIGVDYQNSHKNYKFARALNSHNSKELLKNMMKVILHGANFSVPRGSRVKVDIFGELSLQVTAGGYEADPENNFNDPGDATGETRVENQDGDTRLSDYYYVKDIITRFRTNPNEEHPFSTEMILSKRNWPGASGKLLQQENE
jgi:hypothetical protein